MKRLLALALPLSLLVACLDLEHRVGVHDDGRVDYALRLGLDNKYATSALAKPADERDREWKAQVPEAYASQVAARVEYAPDRVWLILDGTLPDVDAYLGYRDAFIARWETAHKKNPMLYPPVLEPTADGLVVRAAPGPTDPEFNVPQEAWDAGAVWRLVVSADRPVIASEGAVLTEGGRVATFERPLLEVTRDGTFAEVRVPAASGRLALWGLAAVAVLGVGAAAAWAVGRKSAA